ncbi:class I SAM-dependent methyltransferase [Alkalihalobacterium chitinilyticum]|uniref:Methyltransferase domain-containing protein n=1 Tax=Alkalihalobacterium chitinilyticum TaxID=2980103 RepID=A0ABT5VDZ1_9BACI|nr:class I SAM-dependent methyltransferase [Alkalihalobacterium chitinilyticum]MDE5413676.1 methyltransferase domain-containing protein [Alkalihalobacterium chitinilyticum]
MYMDALAKLGVGGAHPGGLSLTKNLIQKEKILTHSRVLDIGCGTGQTSAYFYKQFRCHVTACDIHHLMVEKANERFKQLELPIQAIIANAESLPFPDQYFDFIISESVTAFTDIEQSLKEFRRVLKKGGKLLAIEMTHDGTLSTKDLKKVKEFYQLKKVMTKEDWEKALKDVQFSAIQIDRFKMDESNAKNTTDFQPSPLIDEEVHHIFLEHEKLMIFHQSSIFPSIIKAEK